MCDLPIFPLCLIPLLTFSWNCAADENIFVEIFTTSTIPISRSLKTNQQGAVSVERYLIDDVGRFETTLSRGLPQHTADAKPMVLARIDKLGKGQIERVRHAALGLSKAMQYGVDRYPAIVFDHGWVIYGLTDLSLAFSHYQAWRGEARP